MSNETISIPLSEIVQPETRDVDDSGIGPLSLTRTNAEEDEGATWLAVEL